MKRNLIAGGLFVLSVAVVFILFARQDLATAGPMTQDWFIERAMEIARAYGNAEPRDIAAATMSYTEFEALLDDAEYFPEEMAAIPVWVVTMKGTVRFPAPPGREGPTPPSEYDNMYVVLNAVTGEVMEVGSRAPGHEISLPASKVPAEFPYQPESPPEPTPKSQPTATPVPKP